MQGSLPAFQSVPVSCASEGGASRVPIWCDFISGTGESLKGRQMGAEYGSCLRWNQRQRGTQAGAARVENSQSQPGPFTSYSCQETTHEADL